MSFWYGYVFNNNNGLFTSNVESPQMSWKMYQMAKYKHLNLKVEFSYKTNLFYWHLLVGNLEII